MIDASNIMYAQYQSVAVEVCFRVGADPYSLTVPGDDSSPRVWEACAKEIALHAVIHDVLRQYGMAA